VPLAKAFSSITNSSWLNHWWLTLVLKIGLACFIPFFSDEAYYWVWSKNLQLSYFDHPPFVAWLFWLGQMVDQFGTASRIPFVIVSHLTIWLWCSSLAKDLSNSKKVVLHWILLLHPLTGLGGLVANPDIPFLFFWSLSVSLYLKSFASPQSKVLPVFLGISLGLAFCSKYLIALILPVILVHLFMHKNWKRILPSTYLITFIFGLLFSLPVLIWNHLNDWISIQFQISHGLGQKDWKPQWTLDFLAGTLALLFPPFVYLFFKKVSWKNKDFHTINFIVLFLFFTYTSFKGDTELNWPIMIYPSFFLILLNLNFEMPKVLIGYFFFFAGISVFLVGGTLGIWGQKLHGRLNEGIKTQKIFEQSQDFSPLYLSTYQVASYFWFISKNPYYKLNSSSRPDFFDTLPESNPKSSLFYFLKEQYQVIPDSFKANYTFEKIKDLDFNYEVYKAVKNP